MTSAEEERTDADLPTATTAKWLVLLSLLPMLGVLLFGVAGILGIRAFAHNNDCELGFSGLGAGGCSHYSYALPIAVGVAGLLLAIGGAAFANYYALRNVGLPLMASLRKRGGSR